jgi:hypothetical protein
MEIKATPVPTSIRFPVQPESPAIAKPQNGVSWVYIALLCGGCILITVLVYEAKKQNQRLENEYPKD